MKLIVICICSVFVLLTLAIFVHDIITSDMENGSLHIAFLCLNVHKVAKTVINPGLRFSLQYNNKGLTLGAYTVQ